MKKIRRTLLVLCIICMAFTSCAAGPVGLKPQKRTVVNQEFQFPELPWQYVTVAKDGSGEFATIQAAVDATPDKGTILVKPGVYIESVKIVGKSINLVGCGADKVILACDTVSYLSVPLEIAAGSVSGMTIYGMHTKECMTDKEREFIISAYGRDAYEKFKDISGYAVHIEQDYLYGRSLTFDNCKIISENNQCIGIGARGRSRIVFRNCEIMNANYAACIFVHDSVVESVGGKAEFIMENCNMVSSCEYALALYTYNSYNSFDLTFNNVNVSSRNGGELPMPVMVENFSSISNGWQGLCNTKLTKQSFGNNVAFMNY